MFAHHTSSAHRFFLVLAAVLPVVVSSVPAAAFVPPASSSVVPNVVTTIDEPTTVVGSGSVWSYLDDGQAPPADWNDPAFDDSGWASGAAELGYGDGDETTVTANNGITTYFRHTFDAPDGIDNLTMSVLRDDGAVIYLNGTEIWRNNLPTGTIDHTTLAPGLINGSDETTWIDVDLPDTVLIDGTNTLAAEIHQNSPSSTDTSFDLTLTGTLPAVPLTPVAAGSVWSYLDDGQAPPADWNDPAFDDSGWASGAAELGYGDGDETTVTANNGITTYFRHTFDAPDGIDNLTMSVLRDDGAVIYLNGTEIWRNNLPTGTIDHTTLAPGLINGSDETTWIDVDLPDTVLIDGTNTLAAEIHQNSPSSTDTSFDLTLTGTIIDLTPPDPPTITSPTHPDPTTAYPNQNPTFEWTATDTSGIVDYSWELDQQPSTTPDTTPDGADPTTTYTDIQPGTWHFHIRARNGAGLWSDPAHQPHHHHRHRPHLHV